MESSSLAFCTTPVLVGAAADSDAAAVPAFICGTGAGSCCVAEWCDMYFMSDGINCLMPASDICAFADVHKRQTASW